MKAPINRPIAVLDLSRKVAEFIVQGNGIHDSMEDNSWFDASQPKLETLATTLTALARHEAGLVVKPPLYTVAERNVIWSEAATILRSLQSDVQVKADTNPAEAITIIESAGMKVKKPSTRQKQVFSVENTKVSGQIRVRAPAIKGSRGMHKCEYTEDLENFENRSSAPYTSKATTVISDLKQGKKYAIFHQAISGNGQDEWHGPLFIIIT